LLEEEKFFNLERDILAFKQHISLLLIIGADEDPAG